MKTKYKILFTLSILLVALAWYVSEPFARIPFSNNPHLLAKSEIDFQRGTLEKYTSIESSGLFQSKADSILNNAIILNDFIGISTGVYQEGKVKYVAQAGVKDKYSLEQSNRSTKYRIASISKPMTAVAIMKLVDQGRISLKTPIQNYLPQFPKNPGGDITIHHLLNHTSGVGHYTSTWDGMSFTKYKNVKQALGHFQDRPFKFAPGTSYEYTSYGYTVLGAIIEEVTNQTLNAFLTEQIFKPAGMSHTDLESGHLKNGNTASLYIKLGDRFIKSPKTQLSLKYGGGGVQSTAEDLLKFGKAILENTLIDSSLLTQMITITDTLKQGTPYGYGWFVIKNEKYGTILQHGGSLSGTSSFMQIYLDRKVVVASIANSFNSDNEVYLLSRNLANLCLHEKTLHAPVNYYNFQPPNILKNLTGTYVMGKEVLKITRKGNALEVNHEPHPNQLVYPSSPYSFFYRYFDGQLVFDEEGLVYYYFGTPNRYEKR